MASGHSILGVGGRTRICHGLRHCRKSRLSEDTLMSMTGQSTNMAEACRWVSRASVAEYADTASTKRGLQQMSEGPNLDLDSNGKSMEAVACTGRLAPRRSFRLGNDGEIGSLIMESSAS